MRINIERFSNRVENYVKYRPSYPREMVSLFREEMNLTKSSIVADIGSGTGISSKLFLENGNVVYGVEPNKLMRVAAEEFLKGFPCFKSVEGASENTSLAERSVDFIIAAQAFHWFDRQKARDEFKRIIRENGYVALIWNERQLNTNAFLMNYENFLKKFGIDYEQVRHDKIDEKILGDFFKTKFRKESFLNVQTLDFEGLTGRVLSSSYMPSESDLQFLPMIIELKMLFDKYEEKGKIQILYNTNIFFARI